MGLMKPVSEREKTPKQHSYICRIRTDDVEKSSLTWMEQLRRMIANSRLSQPPILPSFHLSNVIKPKYEENNRIFFQKDETVGQTWRQRCRMAQTGRQADTLIRKEQTGGRRAAVQHQV